MSDANVGTNESISDDLISAVAEANHETYASRGQLDKAEADPAATGKSGGGTPTKEKSESTEPESDNADGLDTQDFSRQPVDAADTEEKTQGDVEEPSKTETPQAAEDWKQDLPTPPGDFTLEAPKPDEYGQINPDEYGAFIRAQIKHDNAIEEFNKRVTEVTTNAVEAILPEVKITPGYRIAIESVFTQTGDGEQAVNLAKEFRAALDQVAATKKAEGIQSQKSSITIQKNATVEAKGASQKKANTSRADNLAKRLAKNDNSAYEEVMSDWLDSGKI